jgi:hypothetical protein
MPDLNISIPHSLPQDEVVRRLQSAIAVAKTQYSNRIQNFQENWNGNAGTLHVTVMGQPLQIALAVNPSDVTVQSALPKMPSMFRGQIENAIREQFAKVLA